MKGRSSDAGGPRFEPQTGRVTSESTPSLWGDRHPAVKGTWPLLCMLCYVYMASVCVMLCSVRPLLASRAPRRAFHPNQRDSSESKLTGPGTGERKREKLTESECVW